MNTTDEGKVKDEDRQQTKLADILAECPSMKTDMGEINGKFRMPPTSTDKVMAKKATVADTNERSGMPRSEIVDILMERFGEQNPDVGVQ